MRTTVGRAFGPSSDGLLGAGEAPETVNADAHGQGWLVKIRATAPEELQELMSVEAYKQFLESGE